MTPDYSQILAMLRQVLSVTATPDQITPAYVRTLAANMGQTEETAERLVADLCPPVAPPQPPARTAPPEQSIPHGSASEAPQLLANLGANLLPGRHLAPEFHVIYPGWTGNLRVKAELRGLDQNSWSESPGLLRRNRGYWTFNEDLTLQVRGAACPPGDYLIRLECHFADSDEEPDSSWQGTIRFHVTSQQGGKLEIVSDGRGLVNLQGVNLGQYLRDGGGVKIEARENALVNLQELLDQASEKGAKEPEKATFLQVTLHPMELEGLRAVAPRNIQGRFDLPDGRRILLYAQDNVILGRNRPFSPQYAHTDIALRLYPRSDEHDKLTRLISEQHLKLSVSEGMLRLEDVRKSTSQGSFPATIDGRPLGAPVEVLGVRPLHYQTTLDQQRKTVAGLEINAFQSPTSQRQRVLSWLSQLERDWPDLPGWLRDAAGIDAVLIERENWPDELNRREAYLLTLGLVALGSDSRCPIRMQEPDIAPEHALLCHWDGQFRITPVGNAPVKCGGRPVTPGRFATLSPGQPVTLGQTEVQFQTAVQYGLE